jgi:tetratricopeptide (TPR) repeat protein
MPARNIPPIALCLLLGVLPAASLASPVPSGTRAAQSLPGPAALHFANSGSAAAQAPFLQGLWLLHNFEYADARREFQAAEAADGGFALAYWGEALTYNHSLWGEQDTAAARAALGKLAPTREQRLVKANTSRERAYLDAVEQLYGAGTKEQRDAAYLEAMQALAQRYPDDVDGRALHALALLSVTGGRRDATNYMRAAAEAQAALALDPHHPGALHYLIHAFDDPVHAPLGLSAARLYGKMAASAEHALHMPSHIYFALGLWDDAIEANAASLAAARASGDPGYHPLLWLIYAHLQRQQRAEAAALLRPLAAEAATPAGREARVRLAYARATWLVETRGDASEDALVPVDSTGVEAIGYFAAQDFAIGLAALDHGDAGAAGAALDRLRARIAASNTAGTAVTLRWFERTTPAEQTEARGLADALEGAIRFQAGEHAAGLAQLQRAIAATSALEFEYGPPWSVKPLDELLGELLLADGRAADARAAFQRTLATYPQRRITLEDLAAAERARPAASGAEAPSREQLIGAWRLLSIEVRDAAGTHPDPFYGPQPEGLIVYAPSGKVSVQMSNARAAGDRLAATRSTARDSPALARARLHALDGYYAYYGSWDYDAATGTMTHHVDHALYSGEEGETYTQSLTLESDRLVFTRQSGAGATTSVQRKVWERAVDRPAPEAGAAHHH